MLIYQIKINSFRKIFPSKYISGFTLIELVIVISLLALGLISIYPLFTSYNRGTLKINQQIFENSINNMIIGLSRDIRNANAIDIYENKDSLTSGNLGSKLYIQFTAPSSSVIYQLDGHIIEKKLNDGQEKKLVVDINNVQIDNLSFQKNENGNKIDVNISYSIKTGINTKKVNNFSTSIVKRNPS